MNRRFLSGIIMFFVLSVMSGTGAAEELLRPGLVAHYFLDATNWGGTWPDTVSTPESDAREWTFSEYKYSRIEPLINHEYVRRGWFSVRWKGLIDIGDACAFSGVAIRGAININPNNRYDNEFILKLDDGTIITRDDLKDDYTGYSGTAVSVRINPKGEGNQNSLVVNEERYVLLNSRTYDISAPLMFVDVYKETKRDANGSMGRWHIGIAAKDASIKWNREYSAAGRDKETDKTGPTSVGSSLKPRNYTCTFSLFADDGCRLHIDGETLIDDWRPCWEQDPTAVRHSKEMSLSEGRHKIVVEYFQGQSLDEDDSDPVRLSWSCKELGIEDQVVLPERFFHTANDLKSRGR